MYLRAETLGSGLPGVTWRDINRHIFEHDIDPAIHEDMEALHALRRALLAYLDSLTGDPPPFDHVGLAVLIKHASYHLTEVSLMIAMMQDGI